MYFFLPSMLVLLILAPVQLSNYLVCFIMIKCSLINLLLQVCPLVLWRVLLAFDTAVILSVKAMKSQMHLVLTIS